MPAHMLLKWLSAGQGFGDQHKASSGRLVFLWCACVCPCSMPPKLAMQLLQRQFSRDQGLAWKFELVRRRDQLLKAEADAQAS